MSIDPLSIINRDHKIDLRTFLQNSEGRYVLTYSTTGANPHAQDMITGEAKALDNGQNAALEQALRKLEKKLNVKFVPVAATDNPYLQFVQGDLIDGTTHRLGRTVSFANSASIRTGNKIIIDNDRESPKDVNSLMEVVEHELGHALGLDHADAGIMAALKGGPKPDEDHDAYWAALTKIFGAAPGGGTASALVPRTPANPAPPATDRQPAQGFSLGEMFKGFMSQISDFFASIISLITSMFGMGKPQTGAGAPASASAQNLATGRSPEPAGREFIGPGLHGAPASPNNAQRRP